MARHQRMGKSITKM